MVVIHDEIRVSMTLNIYNAKRHQGQKLNGFHRHKKPVSATESTTQTTGTSCQ